MHQGLKSRIAMLAALGYFSSGAVFAQAQSPVAEPQVPATVGRPFELQYDGHLTIRENLTGTQISTKRIKILTPSVIQSLSQQQVQFIEGMQNLETVEAYTEKADGRHIPVDPSNILTRDGASGLQSTYAPDLKLRTIIFSDVSVGDTLVMTNKVEVLKNEFPGQFMDFDIFPHSQPLASVKLTIEAPASLDISVKTTGDAVHDDAETADGIQRHTITVAPGAYRPEEPGAVSPLDHDPSVAVSTFHSYEDLGLAYGKAALPKTAVTPRIAELAETITKDITDPRAQAEAIDAWVKKNIRYVALFLAVGRVVPHDSEAILHNKFGDCKDKATLMMALLAAKGITSEAALVNLGNSYTLPEPPTLAALNHVILYLPAFDLYDDPTANGAAFGVLTAQTYDKPVVRVSTAGATRARTPRLEPEEHVAHAMTTVKFAADGSITGETIENNKGLFGTALRYVGSLVQQIGAETVAQRQLQAFNTPGTGLIELGTSQEIMDPAVIKSSFTLSNRFQAPSPGNIGVIPVGLPLTVRPGGLFFGTRLSGRTSPFVCFAGTEIEDIDATFDPGLPMPLPPVAVNIDNAFFSYHSSFKIDNRTLKIHRELISRVKQQVCPAEMEAQIATDMEKIRRDVYSGYHFASLQAAAPAKQPPVVNLSVSAGHKRQVEFAYSIDVGCSSRGFTNVTIVEQPQHGKITTEQGTGKSSFPASNPRSACNGKPVEGTVIWYEPEQGFSGADTALLNFAYPDGNTFRRRYSMNVNQSSEADAKSTAQAAPQTQIQQAQVPQAQVPQAPEPQAPVAPTPVIQTPVAQTPEAQAPAAPTPVAQTPTPPRAETAGSPAGVELKRVAIMDQQLRIGFFYELNPDCTVIGMPAIRITDQPMNGKVSVEEGSGFSSFPANNTRSKCNGSRSNGTVVFYKPNPGYTGSDTLTVQTIFHDGNTVQRRYAIEVK